MPTRLTANVKGGGCASKLSPRILDQALRSLPRQPRNERVLVGYETSDDAGIYDLTADSGKALALVQTVDFFTPIVDDPFVFGAIAAANALSDVYAMGGRPISALSLVVFPPKGDLLDLEAILKGGASKMEEAGCAILGGHSIADDEVKFGYAVTGLINPNAIWKNAGARVGDVLIFSKRIGTGVISSALKKGVANNGDVHAATQQMLTLNQSLAEALRKYEVHACTDVTGFGLLGHAREMAVASNVTLHLRADAVQYLPGAVGYSREGAHSTGLSNNREFVGSCVEMPDGMAREIEALFYDPQTSGGLLVSMSAEEGEQLMAERSEVYVVGSVEGRSAKPLRVSR